MSVMDPWHTVSARIVVALWLAKTRGFLWADCERIADAVIRDGELAPGSTAELRERVEVARVALGIVEAV